MARLSTQLRVFRAVLLLLVVLTCKAEAASLEVRAGGGGIETFSTARYNAYVEGSYERADGLLLFNTGERSDLFIGAEYTSSREATQHFNRYPSDYANPQADFQNLPYSLRIRAASFGMRLKPIVGNKWHLYLAPGLLWGRADYSADRSALPLVLLSSNEGASRFIRGRLGLGAIFELSKQIALGVEAAFTQSTPEFTIWARNNITGAVEPRTINDKAEMWGVMIGLHYNFRDY